MVQHFMKLRLQSAYRKEHQRALIMGTRMVLYCSCHEGVANDHYH